MSVIFIAAMLCVTKGQESVSDGLRSFSGLSAQPFLPTFEPILHLVQVCGSGSLVFGLLRLTLAH